MSGIGRDFGPREINRADTDAVPAGADAAPVEAQAAPARRDPILDRAKNQAISAVLNDKESMRRADAPVLSTIMPDGLGWTGSMRNWGYVLSGQDPTDDKIASKVCTGIAEQTAKAIEAAIKSGKAKDIESVGTIDRKKGALGVYHTATEVTLKDGRKFVLDFHATLNPRNPEVSTREEWLKGNRQ